MSRRDPGLKLSSQPPAQSDLVYDVGLHDGADTAFYLSRGYRVVAVDARPDAIEAAARTFDEPIRGGRLTLVHRAVTATGAPAAVTFYVSARTEWSSLARSIANRDRVGASELSVPTTTLRQLIERFGTPYYLKIDIEGMDEVALEDLASTRARPTYISVEAESADDTGTTDEEALRKLDLLASLGYSRFKLVDQDSLRVLSPTDIELGPRRGLASRLRRQLPRRRSARVHVVRLGGRREVFPFGATGPFGPDLAGTWCDLPQAQALLVAARRAYFQRRDSRVHGFWCDWHAAA
jgi:FkbM family methyltransferase